MCNEAARRMAIGQIREDFAERRIPLRFPEGIPNLAATDSVRITDSTAIVRYAEAGAELVIRRWSWPMPNGRPLYNFRSEGRRFDNTQTGGRCLIPLDAFYEFTDAAGGPRKRKDKWSFALAPGIGSDSNRYASSDRADAFFCIAGIWRWHPTVGEAFTMLTADPGPDVVPYHSRQIVLLRADAWLDWIMGVVPAAALIAPPLAGTLTAQQIVR